MAWREQLIHRPLLAHFRHHDTTSQRDLSARTDVRRRDAISASSHGLDQMLGGFEHHQITLQNGVVAAAEELACATRDACRAPIDPSLREALGRAEQRAASSEIAANIARQMSTPLNLIQRLRELIKDHPEVNHRSV